MLKKKEWLYRARCFESFSGQNLVRRKSDQSQNFRIRTAIRNNFNKKAAWYRENVIKTHRDGKRTRSSGTSSKCDMPKTWRDHDERERGRVRPRSDDETALTVSAKRLMSTTASRAESLSRSLRSVTHYYSPSAGSPTLNLTVLFSPQIFRRFRVFSNKICGCDILLVKNWNFSSTFPQTNPQKWFNNKYCVLFKCYYRSSTKH